MVLFLLAIFVTTTADGSPLHSLTARNLESYTSEQGLSSEFVEAIVSDSQGFLWLGTRGGLNRFDGYGFRSWRHDPRESTSLASNWIERLLVDRRDHLWISLRSGGLDRFDPQEERFFHYRYRADGGGELFHPVVSELYEDREGRVWIGTSGGGLYRYFPAEDRLIAYRTNPNRPASASGIHVTKILEDDQNRLWIGTATGLLRYDPATDALVSAVSLESDILNTVPILDMAWEGSLWIASSGFGLLNLDPSSDSSRRFLHRGGHTSDLSGFGVLQKVCADGSGGLWIFSPSAGLGRFDSQSLGNQPWKAVSPESESFASSTLTTCLLDDSNRLWLASGDELASFTADHSLQLATLGPIVEGEPESPFTSLHQDRNGLIWLGTAGAGLTRIDPTRDRFTHWCSDAKPNPIQATAILISKDSDRWVGTLKDGLWRFTADEESIRYPLPKASPSIVDRILTLEESPQGDLLIGTDQGLLILDREHRFRTPPEAIIRRATASDGSDPGMVSITALEFDEKNWWIGTFGDGLIRLGDTTEFFPPKGSEGSLPSGFILDLALDTRGELLMGTIGAGLIRKTRDHQFVAVELPGQPSTVTQILRQDNQLWVGTESSGLLRRDPTGGWTLWTEQQGLASNKVQALIVDLEGNLWISGDRGLSQFEPNGEGFTTYDRLDGLVTNEFLRGGAAMASKGHLLFLDRSGLLQLKPEELRRQRPPPNIALTYIEIDGEPLSRLPLEDGTLILAPHQRTFTLEFAALDLLNSRKNLYSYLLEGYDPRWSRPTTIRRVSWSNLPGGRYRLQVKAAGADGHWSDLGFSLPIEIRPPFWKTLWFRLLVLSLAALLAYGLSLWRIRSLLTWRRKLTELVTQKTEDLRLSNEKKEEVLGVVAHDLRNPITASSGWTELALEELKKGSSPQEAIGYLGRSLASSAQASELLDTLLDYSAIESGKIHLHPEILDLDALMKNIVADHQLLANHKAINLELIPCTVPVHLRADPLRLTEILNNLLSNAIKFTWPEGKVTIHREITGQKVWIHIADNGQGLSPDELDSLFEVVGPLSSRPTDGEPSHGLGLAIVRKLVHLHQGQLRVTGEKGKGCTFSFSLPLETDLPSSPIREEPAAQP